MDFGGEVSGKQPSLDKVMGGKRLHDGINVLKMETDQNSLLLLCEDTATRNTENK